MVDEKEEPIQDLPVITPEEIAFLEAVGALEINRSRTGVIDGLILDHVKALNAAKATLALE